MAIKTWRDVKKAESVPKRILAVLASGQKFGVKEIVEVINKYSSSKIDIFAVSSYMSKFMKSDLKKVLAKKNGKNKKNIYSLKVNGLGLEDLYGMYKTKKPTVKKKVVKKKVVKPKLRHTKPVAKKAKKKTVKPKAEKKTKKGIMDTTPNELKELVRKEVKSFLKDLMEAI